MLTAAQVCERLDISTKTLTRMVKRGDLAAIKTAGAFGHYRIKEEDLEDYLKRNQVVPDKEAAAS